MLEEGATNDGEEWSKALEKECRKWYGAMKDNWFLQSCRLGRMEDEATNEWLRGQVMGGSAERRQIRRPSGSMEEGASAFRAPPIYKI